VVAVPPSLFRWSSKVAGRAELGQRGEDEAARYLKRLGYRIISRRERVLRGDIDIIALDGRTVVFVEVRSRSSTAHGHPVETIDQKKQRRLVDLANAYIRRHRLEDCSVRIDVVTVTFETPVADTRWRLRQPRPLVEHFQNAFDSPW
jgi:putative endonuclease